MTGFVIPTGAPKGFTQGDTISWYEDRDAYPPPTWTLTVEWIADGDHQSVTASDNGDSRHLVALTAAASKAFKVDTNYRYVVQVTDGTERYTLEEGYMWVAVDPSLQVDGYDNRTHAEIVLDAIRAVMQGKATTDQANMSIEGESLSRYSWEELRELEASYHFRVIREQRPNTLVHVPRFT